MPFTVHALSPYMDKAASSRADARLGIRLDGETVPAVSDGDGAVLFDGGYDRRPGDLAVGKKLLQPLASDLKRLFAPEARKAIRKIP